MASTYLSKTFGSSGSQQTATFSVWVKRANLGGSGKSLFGYKVDANNFLEIRFGSSDNLLFRNYNGGTYTWRFDTNREFRDTNAWYHLVFAVDSTQSTESNRFKLYVNGVQETSFSTATYPSQNANMKWGNNAYAHLVGDTTNGDYFDGIMSHINVIDGTAYDASTFGETDATTGIWKAKTNPSVTYGTNGFFLKFENSGSMGTDSSGNANNFTVNGTMTQTIDTPSNVFATQNPLQYGVGATLTFENGNTTIQNDAAVGTISTLGASSGKYYWEGKLISFTNTGGGQDKYQIGINGTVFGTNVQFTGGSNPYGYSYLGTGNKGNNGTESAFGNTYTINDIIGVALDLDNNKLYFSKNGVWQNSGDPTSGATGTGAAYTITAASSTDSGFYFGCCGHKDNLAKWSMNFGNGYFGTTAVSSAENPDDGIGIFEYDVPAGYRALCTKSINAQEYS